jgi:thiol-disulfide isomerase/thioredoxin
MICSHTRVVCIAVLALAATTLGVASVSAAPAPDPLLHKPAPLFARNDLNHHPVDLGAYRGHVVLLTFWATWCAPCQLEMPHFIAWQREYGPRGLQIIAVAMDDTTDPVTAMVHQKRLNYPVVMGDEKLGMLYEGILGLPVTYLIDRKGIVAAKFKGEGHIELMNRKIQELLRR